jgi:hypothetical protein
VSAEKRVPGKHVQLILDRRHVTVEEQSGVLLRVPWQSIVEARVHDEPGVPRLRLDLTVRLGPTTFPLSLWFDATWRAELARLVEHVEQPADTLPLLDVRCAPPGNEWLAFVPGDCSAEVLRRTSAG